jgi:hypothetical protein
MSLAWRTVRGKPSRIHPFRWQSSAPTRFFTCIITSCVKGGGLIGGSSAPGDSKTSSSKLTTIDRKTSPLDDTAKSTHQRDHELVGEEFALLHLLLRDQPQLRLRLDLRPQQVAWYVRRGGECVRQGACLSITSEDKAKTRADAANGPVAMWTMRYLRPMSGACVPFPEHGFPISSTFSPCGSSVWTIDGCVWGGVGVE